MAIDLEERFGFFRFTRKGARREYAAVMRSIERRRTVCVSFSESNTALPNHAVDMIDRAGNELLKQIERLLIAELVEPWPEFFLRMNFFHADAGRLRAWLEQPGTGNPGHEFANSVVVEQVDEFGDEDAFFPGRSEEHTSELQSLAYLVCRLLL